MKHIHTSPVEYVKHPVCLLCRPSCYIISLQLWQSTKLFSRMGYIRTWRECRRGDQTCDHQWGMDRQHISVLHRTLVVPCCLRRLAAVGTHPPETIKHTHTHHGSKKVKKSIKKVKTW